MYRFDLFHQLIKLKYNGSDRFSTNTGCFLTICVILITLSLSIVTFKSILSFDSPTVTIDRTVLPVPNPTSLNESEFVFAIKMPDLNLSSTLVALQLTQYKAIQHDNGTIEEILIPIPFQQCTPEYLKNYNDSYYTLGLNTAFCPDPSANFDMRISGTYRNAISEYVVITVTRCKNDTSRPDLVCQSEEEIASYFANNALSAAYVEFFYSNTIISPTAHEKPVSYYLDSLYWYVLPGVQTIDTEVFMNQQEIITDDHLFLEDWYPRNETTYYVDPAETTTKPRSLLPVDWEGTYSIINIWFGKSRFKYTTRRLYPKLQEGLASVGSVFSLCVIVFGIIASMYTERAYSLHFASQFYDLDDKSPRNDNSKRKAGSSKDDKASRLTKDKKGKNLRNMKAKTSKPQISTNKDIEEGPLESNPTAPLENTLYKKPKISYNLGLFLMSCFPCFRRKKNILIKKAIDAAQKEFDLVEIVKKLHELDRLKKILLEEDEMRMLSFLQRPVISADDPSPASEQESESRLIKSQEKEKEATVLMERSTQAKLESTAQISIKTSKNLDPNDPSASDFIASVQSYEKLLKKMKHSTVSRKILKYMDPKINDEFYEFRLKSKLAGSGPNLTQTEFKERKSHRQMSKLEAGMIIASKMKDRYMRRREKIMSERTNLSPHAYKNGRHRPESLGEDSMLSEKEPLGPVTQEVELKRFKQEPLSPTISIHFNEMSSFNFNSSTLQNIPFQSDHEGRESSPVKKGTLKGVQSPVAFPKSFASNARLKSYGST